MVRFMYRRSGLENFRRAGVSRLAMTLAVALAGALAVTPSLTHSDEIKPSVRPIVALDQPRDEIDVFMDTFGTMDATSVEGSAEFERHFLKLSPDTLSAASAFDAVSAPDKRSILMVDADPNFERWQKDADERLKEENSAKTPPMHPLAAANPGKSVVVCEAGCATTKDEVVYIADVVPAVLPEGKFEPSSSTGAAPLDEGSVPCIAGCYERPEKSKTAPRRNAENRDTAPKVYVAAVTSAPATIGVVITPRRPVHIKIQKPAAIHSHRIQVGLNGAIIERRSAIRPKTAAVHIQSPAPGHTPDHALGPNHGLNHVRQAASHSWRATVSYALPHVPRRPARSQTSSWITYVRITAD
jgi:hypothetical protein